MNKGQRTKSRILEVAEAHFSQYGYEGTSLRNIARDANILQPGLYRHFASKEDLYRSVYESVFAPYLSIMKEILEEQPGSILSRDLTDRLIDHIAQHPNIAKLLIIDAVTLNSTVAGRESIAGEWLRRILDEGRKLNQRAGVDLSTDQIGVEIIAMFNLMFGYFWSSALTEYLLGRSPVDADLVDTHKEVVAKMLRSIR